MSSIYAKCVPERVHIMNDINENATERLLREMQKNDIRHKLGIQIGQRVSDTVLESRRIEQFVQGLPTSRIEAIAQRLPRLSPMQIARQGTVAQHTITTVADLGPLIRTARKAMKLSQGEFAAHAGVGRRFVSELESGKPSLEFDKVLACAAAAGVDIIAKPRRVV